MENLLFSGLVGLAAAAQIWWGTRKLPGEDWQMVAAMPAHKEADGSWRGVNLTFYGVLSANAYLAAAALMLFMLGAVGTSPVATLALMAPLLGVCVPASRMVARVVEKKAYTFTVGGAFFVGLVLAPWICLLAGAILDQSLDLRLPVMPALAALAVAYAFGEGLGRLACLSFGCCYGRPLDQAPGWMQKLLGPWAVVYHGHTKKASYEGGLEGRPVVPIQTITSVIFLGAGVVALYLYLEGAFYAALLLAVAATQLWRAASELWRADFRGHNKISAYQWMALISVAYAALLPWLLPGGGAAPVASVTAGLSALWSPGPILSLQGLWLMIVIYTGRSRTTASRISFHVVHENI